MSVDNDNILRNTMLMADAKDIIHDDGYASQDSVERSHLDDGLRILARIIARYLLAKRSVRSRNSDSKTKDSRVSGDSS